VTSCCNGDAPASVPGRTRAEEAGLIGDRSGEFLDEPALPDPGLARYERERCPTAFGTIERISQARELRVPADERNRHVRPLYDLLESPDRHFSETLEIEGAEVRKDSEAGGRRMTGGPDENLTRLGLPLEPCGHIDAGPHSHTLAILQRGKVDEGFPGFDADPHSNGLMCRSWQVCAFIRHAKGPSHIVDVPDRSAEEDEDLIADVLLDRSARRCPDRADLTKAIGKESLHPLGTKTLPKVG
jgi:hypothetical protein